MQIICKYKDFYDYKCYEYGRDPFPAFDRRGSIKLTQESFMEWLMKIDKEWHKERFWEYINDDPKHFYLEIGFDKYLFTASNFSRKLINTSANTYKYNCDIKPIRVINSSKKIWPAVIVLSRIDIKLTRDWKYCARLKIETCEERDIDYGNGNRNFSYYNKDKIINLPILAETKLAGLLNPHDVYVSLDTFLRSLYNDVNQESEGLTDKEKAVNKGFNAKESFRNVFPRGN